AHFAEGHGANDMIRRLFLPGLPPTECVRGYIFFPWGTGPTFPIFCDRKFRVLTVPGGVGTQFITQSGEKFAVAVAEVGQMSLAEAKRAVAKAAGVSASELGKFSVKDIGRKIVEKAETKLGVQNVKPASDDTVGTYFEKLSRRMRESDP